MDTFLEFLNRPIKKHINATAFLEYVNGPIKEHINVAIFMDTYLKYVKVHKEHTAVIFMDTFWNMLMGTF